MERWLDGSPARTLDRPTDVEFGQYNHITTVIPIMEIKAPKGGALIYKSEPCNLDVQCRAIKAFMEEHKDD